MRRCGLVILVLAAACRPSTVVHLTPPELEGARTVIVGVRDGLNQRVWIFDADVDAFRIPLTSIDPDTELEVELVALRDDRDELGLPGGEIQGTHEDGAVPLPVDRSAAAYTVTVKDGDATSWAPTTPSDQLLGFRIDNPSPCPTLQLIDRMDLDFAEYDAVVPIQFGRIMIRPRGMRDRTLVFSSSFDDITVADVPTSVAFNYGVVIDNVRVWLADDNYVWRAEVRDPDFIGVTSTTAVPGSAVRAFTVLDDDIFVHGEGADFWRIPANGAPERLFDFDDVRGAGGLYVARAVLDPDEKRVASTNSHTNQVVIYEDGQIRETAIEFERGIRSLVWSRAAQTYFAGSIDSNVYRLDGNDWILLERPALTVTQVRALGAIDESIIFVAGDILGQYRRSRFCNRELPGAEIDHLSAYGNRLNVVSDGDVDKNINARIEVRALDLPE